MDMHEVSVDEKQEPTYENVEPSSPKTLMYDVPADDDEPIYENVEPSIGQDPDLVMVASVGTGEDTVNMKITRYTSYKTKKTSEGGVVTIVSTKLKATVLTPGSDEKELWVLEKECMQECEMDEFGNCIHRSENVKSLAESRNGGLKELTNIEGESKEPEMVDDVDPNLKPVDGESREVNPDEAFIDEPMTVAARDNEEVKEMYENVLKDIQEQVETQEANEDKINTSSTSSIDSNGSDTDNNAKNRKESVRYNYTQLLVQP